MRRAALTDAMTRVALGISSALPLSLLTLSLLTLALLTLALPLPLALPALSLLSLALPALALLPLLPGRLLLSWAERLLELLLPIREGLAEIRDLGP